MYPENLRVLPASVKCAQLFLIAVAAWRVLEEDEAQPREEASSEFAAHARAEHPDWTSANEVLQGIAESVRTDAGGSALSNDDQLAFARKINQWVKETRRELSPFCVWVAPPSLDALRARLRARGTEDDEQREARVARATHAIEFSLTARCFDKIVLNEELDAAYAELRAALDDL